MNNTRFHNLKRALAVSKLDSIDEDLETILSDDVKLENIYPDKDENIDIVDKKDIADYKIKKELKNLHLNNFLKKKINF